MKHSLLRWLMLLDAAVLALLGLLLMFQSRPVELAFGFKDLPAGVSYMLGLWGCGLLTLGLGYAVAANDPARRVLWVSMAIARGLLECVFGLVFVARGIVTFRQAGLGIILAALISVAYLILFPRQKSATEDDSGSDVSSQIDARGQNLPPPLSQPPGAPPLFSGPTTRTNHGK